MGPSVCAAKVPPPLRPFVHNTIPNSCTIPRVALIRLLQQAVHLGICYDLVPRVYSRMYATEHCGGTNVSPHSDQGRPNRTKKRKSQAKHRVSSGCKRCCPNRAVEAFQGEASSVFGEKITQKPPTKLASFPGTPSIISRYTVHVRERSGLLI